MSGTTEAFVERIDKTIIRIGHAMSILFAIVVVIAFFEVISRYLFNAPTSWVHETTTFFVSLCLLYGGLHCYAGKRHIAMTFIVQTLSQRLQWIMQLVVHGLTLLFVLMMLYGSYYSAMDAFFKPNGRFHMQTSGTALDSPFPAITKGFFAVCCVIFLVLVLLHIARHFAIRKAVFEGSYIEPAKDGEE